MSFESFFVDEPNKKGFKGCIKPLIKTNLIILIMALFIYIVFYKHSENHLGFLDIQEYIIAFFIIDVIVILTIIGIYFQPVSENIEIKHKLNALEKNKDQLRSIIKSVIEEETQNKNIDKEKVEKIVTSVVVNDILNNDKKED